MGPSSPTPKPPMSALLHPGLLEPTDHTLPPSPPVPPVQPLSSHPHLHRGWGERVPPTEPRGSQTWGTTSSPRMYQWRTMSKMHRVRRASPLCMAGPHAAAHRGLAPSGCSAPQQQGKREAGCWRDSQLRMTGYSDETRMTFSDTTWKSRKEQYPRSVVIITALPTPYLGAPRWRASLCPHSPFCLSSLEPRGG